jgi:hypothetical protein
MKIYRYIINCYSVGPDRVDAEGNLLGCTMMQIMDDTPVLVHEFLTTDYNPQSAVHAGKAQLPVLEAGSQWLVSGVERNELDVHDKNLEFCERAELTYGKLDEKYPDFWDYLHWVVDVLIREEFEETLKAIRERDIVELIDGACDIQVLAANLPYKLLRKLQGLDPATARKNTRESLNRVVNSNLRKLNSAYAAEFRADGKVLKPAGWVKPTFADLITNEN